MARRQPRPPGVNCGRQLERVASSAALRAQATELERCPDTPGKRGAGIGGSSTSLFSAKHRILRFLLGGHPPAGAALGILPSSRPPCREPSRGSVRGFRAFGRFGHSEGTRTVTDGVSSCGGRSGRKIVPHRTTVITRGSGVVPAHACGPPVRRAVPGLDARRSLRTEDRPTSDTTAASGGTSAWRASARSASRPAAGRPRRPPADLTGPEAAGPARRRRA